MSSVIVNNVNNAKVYDLDRDGKEVNLSVILEGIKSGRWREVVEKVRELNDDKERKRAFKSEKVSAFTVSALFDKYRNRNSVKALNGLIAIDIDRDYTNKSNLHIDIKNVRERLYCDVFTYALFSSVSGQGLCVLVKIEYSNEEEFKKCFSYLESYYKRKYDIEIDKSCKDITRLRFVSFDEDLFLYEKSKELLIGEIQEYQKHKKEANNFVKNFTRDKNLVEAILESGNICVDDHLEWIKIGYVLAEEFGEEGRLLYHQLSQTGGGKYKPEKTDEKYDYLLRSNKGNLKMGSLVHFARQNNISLDDFYRSKSDVDFDSIDIDDEDIVLTDKDKIIHYPDTVFTNGFLPPMLQDICDMSTKGKTDISKADKLKRDVTLISSMVILSGIIDARLMNGGSEIFCNISSIVLTSASAGKGNAQAPTGLSYSITQKMDNMREYAMEEYKEKLFQFENRDKKNNATIERPEKPIQEIIQAPSDTTSAELVRRIKENDRLYMYASELDTLIKGNSSTYGNFTDILRCAFTHEQYLKGIKGEDEITKLENMRLSMMFTGTPNQPEKLFSDGAENGLYSRFLWYYCPEHMIEYERTKNYYSYDSKKNVNKEDFFKHLSKEVLKRYEDFGAVRVYPTDEQVKIFNDYMPRMIKKYYPIFGDATNGIVIRHEIMLMRLCALFTALNIDVNEAEFANDDMMVEIDDETFQVAWEIIDVHIKHAFKYLARLSGKDKTEKRDESKTKALSLQEELTDEFTTAEFMQTALKHGFKESKAKRMLSDFLKSHYLEKVKKGHYRKK